MPLDRVAAESVKLNRLQNCARTVAVIPARGGSKGLPRKNIVDFCGKPLIAWTIEQARQVLGRVYVSTDDAQIAAVAGQWGAGIIHRPNRISGDRATSEAAWQHAGENIGSWDIMVGLQCTSPIREPRDVSEALIKFRRESLDSLFTATTVEDRFVWRFNGGLESITYDWRKRRRRQQLERQYLETGSFYIFRPDVLRKGNRLGGKIGCHVMAKHKAFQIDTEEDLKLAEVIMRGYGYAS